MESAVSKRYFIEVSYKGTNFSGFQKQHNANTIQEEVEKSLSTYFRKPFNLIGSSRTDAGVHANQNFFHTDLNDINPTEKDVYHINAILPASIYIRKIYQVPQSMHARFSATARQYKYYLSQIKNPFSQETQWYYPYTLDIDLLNQTALILMQYNNFKCFSKLHTNVTTYNCNILKATWQSQNHQITFTIEANRFLRGMVRAIVGTSLLVARNKITVQNFQSIIEQQNAAHANFSTPAHGLFLEKVFFENL